MISSKKELKFYIMADMMMNRGKFRWTLKDRIIHLFLPDDIMSYLKSLRYYAYYSELQYITPPHTHTAAYTDHSLRFIMG